MKFLPRILGFALFSALAVSSAQAAPVTYNFSASDFLAQQGTVVPPNSSLSGSFTIDGTTVEGINLTIASHTYSASEVGYISNWIVGGTASGVNTITWGNTDFWLVGSFNQQTPHFSDFYYSVAGTNNIFTTHTGSLSVAAVPEPETYALMIAGLGVLGAIARRRKQNSA